MAHSRRAGTARQLQPVVGTGHIRGLARLRETPGSVAAPRRSCLGPRRRGRGARRCAAHGSTGRSRCPGPPIASRRSPDGNPTRGRPRTVRCPVPDRRTGRRRSVDAGLSKDSPESGRRAAAPQPASPGSAVRSRTADARPARSLYASDLARVCEPRRRGCKAGHDCPAEARAFKCRIAPRFHSPESGDAARSRPARRGATSLAADPANR